MRIVIVNTHISKVIGGSQVQCDLIGREMAARGHDVHYLAIKGHGDQLVFPYKLHSVAHSAREIGATCVGIQPDIVYWRYNKKCFYVAARLIANNDVPIVFSVSHIADTEKWASKVGLRGANVKSTLRALQSMLLSRWNFRGFKFASGVVVNNPAHLGRLPHSRQVHIDNSISEHLDAAASQFTWPRPYCLWVSNLKPQKQPERFVQVSQMLGSSGIDFLMVGQVQSRSYQYMEDRGTWPANFHYLGPRDPGTVNALLEGSLLLVHTCLPEGFPNVFIQAWSRGKVVVSLCFDPDGVIEREAVGRYSKTMETLATDIKELVFDEVVRAEMGARARNLVNRRFNLKLNVDRLEQFLQDLIKDRSPGSIV